MTYCVRCPHHVSGNCSIIEKAQIGKKQQTRRLWKRKRNNLTTFTFGTEASKMIAIFTAVITWLRLRRIAFFFPGNMATWCLMSPQPVGTDLSTMASLQNACRTKHLNTLPEMVQTGLPNPPLGPSSPSFWRQTMSTWLPQASMQSHRGRFENSTARTAVSPWFGLL